MRRMSALVLMAGAFLLHPAATSAASKEQQLLMAELRMMQQNQQLLQQSLMALADQRLLIEGMTDTVRALREKSDDTNVRLSSITQELESIRQTIASQPQPVAVAP